MFPSLFECCFWIENEGHNFIVSLIKTFILFLIFYIKLIIKGLKGWGKSPFLQFSLILLSLNQATSCFLQIFKTQNIFWDIAGRSQRLQ